MGRFKDENYKSEIEIWLEEQGYEYKSGAQGDMGYTRTYKVCDGLYYVWVTISLKERKIYVYKEYECGGCVGEHTIIIQEEWLENLRTFIVEVDDELEFWIS